VMFGGFQKGTRVNGSPGGLGSLGSLGGLGSLGVQVTVVDFHVAAER
jgi:hypothetical protein